MRPSLFELLDVFLRVNFLFCLYPWFPRYDSKLLSRIGFCIRILVWYLCLVYVRISHSTFLSFLPFPSLFLTGSHCSQGVFIHSAMILFWFVLFSCLFIVINIPIPILIPYLFQNKDSVVRGLRTWPKLCIKWENRHMNNDKAWRGVHSIVGFACKTPTTW